MNEATKESEILMIMRKVLSSVIKDTTPPPGMQNLLKPKTIEDVRTCFALIAARERELAQARGVQMEQPFYVDARPTAEVVPINQIKAAKNLAASPSPSESD